MELLRLMEASSLVEIGYGMKSSAFTARSSFKVPRLMDVSS